MKKKLDFILKTSLSIYENNLREIAILFQTRKASGGRTRADLLKILEKVLKVEEEFPLTQKDSQTNLGINPKLLTKETLEENRKTKLTKLCSENRSQTKRHYQRGKRIFHNRNTRTTPTRAKAGPSGPRTRKRTQDENDQDFRVPKKIKEKIISNAIRRFKKSQKGNPKKATQN